jgi:hypothetical protein
MTGDELRFEMVTLFRQHRDDALRRLVAGVLRRAAAGLESDDVCSCVADHFDPATTTAFKIVPKIVDGCAEFHVVGRR